MCSRPITRDNNTFACRTCNECIATRRAGWVARAMMERACHKFAFSVTLTYNDDHQHNRDAAAFFQYSDIRDLMGRLRAALREREFVGGVRFICAGEQGDRNRRCHWHIILYSDFDLLTLGKVEGLVNGRKAIITDRSAMLSTRAKKKRLDWSLWPHGFVTFQEADAAAMSYALSYALKDQFTVERSFRTMRETKAENFATGLFRMSKRPAIGEAFLYQKLAAFDQQGACLPALSLKVPDMAGFYVPSGSFREKMLWALKAIQTRLSWEGRQPPQWTALVHSCADLPTDLEVLYAERFIQEAADNEVSAESQISLNSRERAARFAAIEQRNRCQRQIPCLACLRSLSAETLLSIGIERGANQKGYDSYFKDGSEVWADLHRGGYIQGINPHCQGRGHAGTSEALTRL